jgi:hypothetical protein
MRDRGAANGKARVWAVRGEACFLAACMMFGILDAMQTAAEALLDALRSATEDDVARAMDSAYIERLDTPAEMLEFFNRMVDVRVLSDVGGGTLSEG